MNEYTRDTFRGEPTDHRTAVMARRVEAELGITFTCYQGSYSTDVAASGSTHAGGGVLDLNTPGDPTHITRALRRHGFAAWYRTPAQGFTYHIHAVDIGNTRLSADAKLQAVNYKDGGDGLWPLTGGDDPQPYRPKPNGYADFVGPNGFRYTTWDRARTLRQRVTDWWRRRRELSRKIRRANNRLEGLS